MAVSSIADNLEIEPIIIHDNRGIETRKTKNKNNKNKKKKEAMAKINLKN